VFKVVLALVAAIVLLQVVGVDTTAALAGLGIGGVAVALGARKSVENLLGGIFLLTDNVLAIGDQCSISGRMGWIEDITLRSVRVRTLEQTLVSVPAGVLSQASIENFTTRGKILIRTILRLRYDTSSEQLRRALDGIHGLLTSHPDLEAETARIRLVDFGLHAFELELFAYARTSDVATFLGVREALLLQVAAIVESCGSGFAEPVHSPRVDAGEEATLSDED
jgi:MscS family membrane protein